MSRALVNLAENPQHSSGVILGNVAIKTRI